VRGSRLRVAGSRRGALALMLALCAGTAGACGDTVQDQPIPHNTLETLLLAPYPVYWLGRSFQGIAITEAARDPSGAFSVQYGDCLQGGQGTCVTPLRVVTSPDNSFVPGASAPHRTLPLRGARAVVAQHGRAIAIPTGGVVVAIYALTPRLAAAAAQGAVPINASAVARSPPAFRTPASGRARCRPRSRHRCAHSTDAARYPVAGDCPSRGGRTAIVMRVTAHVRPASSLKLTSHTQVVRPR